LFADPQGLDVIGGANTFNRTGSGIDQGQFRTSDQKYLLSISHNYAKRTRRTARLNYYTIAADVMDSSLNVPYSGSVYLVTDMPNVGISRADQETLAAGLMDWLTASSHARLDELLDGES